LPESFDTSINFGARELVFELGNAAFVQRLRFLGGVIFRIFGQVAMGTRFRNGLNDPRTLFLLATAQLFFERGIARGGHGNLVHIRCLSKIHLRAEDGPSAPDTKNPRPRGRNPASRTAGIQENEGERSRPPLVS
jgi:hypothetical protein